MKGRNHTRVPGEPEGKSIKRHRGSVAAERRIAIVDRILVKERDGDLDLTEDEAVLLRGVLKRYKLKLIERWL